MRLGSEHLLLRVRQVREASAERRLRAAQEVLRLRQQDCAAAERRLACYQSVAQRYRARLFAVWRRMPMSYAVLLRWRALEARVTARLFGLAEAVRLAQETVASAEGEVATARTAWRHARGERLKWAEIVAQAERQKARERGRRASAWVEEQSALRGVQDAFLG